MAGGLAVGLSTVNDPALGNLERIFLVERNENWDLPPQVTEEAEREDQKHLRFEISNLRFMI